MVELAPRRRVVVTFPRWIGDARHVGGLGNNSYGDATAQAGLESNGNEIAEAEVA